MLVTIFLKAKNVFAPIQSPQKMVLVQCVRLHSWALKLFHVDLFLWMMREDKIRALF